MLKKFFSGKKDKEDAKDHSDDIQHKAERQDTEVADKPVKRKIVIKKVRQNENAPASIAANTPIHRAAAPRISTDHVPQDMQNQANLRALRDKTLALQNELDQIKTEYEDSQNELYEVNAALKELQEEFNALEEERDSLLLKQDKQSFDGDNSENFENIQDQEQNEAKTASPGEQEELASLSEEIDRLRSEIEQLRLNNKSLKAAQQESNEKISALKSENEALNQDLRKAEDVEQSQDKGNKEADLSQAYENLESEVERLFQLNAQLKSQSQAHSKVLDQHIQENNKLREEIESLKSESASKGERTNELSSELDGIKSDLAKAILENTDANQKIIDLENTNKELINKLKSEKSAKEELTLQKKNLTQSIQSLESGTKQSKIEFIQSSAIY